MDGKQTFTPREFLDSLKKGIEVRHPTILRGMTKPAEDDDEALLFAHGSACTEWVKIPLAMIETVELLRVVRCKDHTHPLVVLQLKQAESEEGRLFQSLMRAPAGRPPRRGGRIIHGPRSRGRQSGGEAGSVVAANADFPWCETIPEYDVDADGNVWCLDWCWESEQQAAYNPC